MTLEALDPDDRDRLLRLARRHPTETPATLSARFSALTSGYRPSVLLVAAGAALDEVEEDGLRQPGDAATDGGGR